VTGHLCKARFGSVAMDEERLLAVRYVAEPRAGATGAGRASPRIWRGARRALMSVAPLLDRCAGRFADLIETEPSAAEARRRRGPPRRSGAAWLRGVP